MDHGAGVGAVADGKGVAQPLLHGPDDPAEQVVLLPGVALTVLPRLVGYGEVGEDALGLQARQGAVPADAVHAGVEMGPLAEVAQAGHAGVHLDMHLQRAAQADGLGAVLHRLGLAGDGLGDVQVYEPPHLLLGGVAQDEDGHGDAVIAQLHGLVHGADGQIVGPLFLQHPADHDGAVAVGVGLHHAQEFHVLPHAAAQHVVIVGDGVQIHLGPCSL